MARLVRLDATGPRKLDASDIDDEQGDVAICQCGLSDEFPFCDGSHRETRDESPGTIYRYADDDDEQPRRVVSAIEFGDG